MINLIRAEFFKLSKSTGFKICFLLSCISASALVYISHCIAVGSMSAEISGSASGLTEILIVSLLGSLLAGLLVCSDFETKTIHDALACGNGRRAVVISKGVIYVLLIAMLLLPYMIATIVGFCIGARFATPFVASVFIGILSDKEGLSITAGTIGKIVSISLVTMLVHAARLSICIPLAFKIRKPIAILAIGFTFNAVIDLVIGLLIKVSVIENMISFTPFARNFLILTMSSDPGTLIKAAICSLVFICFIVALTDRIFKKAEIK